MIKEFKKKKKKKNFFSETGQSGLYEIETKVKKLEIRNDAFNLYLDNFNKLF